MVICYDEKIAKELNFKEEDLFKMKMTIDDAKDVYVIEDDTDELLDYAICPKCSAEMVVYKNSHIGVNPDSEGIIKTRVYGI